MPSQRNTSIVPAQKHLLGALSSFTPFETTCCLGTTALVYAMERFGAYACSRRTLQRHRRKLNTERGIAVRPTRAFISPAQKQVLGALYALTPRGSNSRMGDEVLRCAMERLANFARSKHALRFHRNKLQDERGIVRQRLVTHNAPLHPAPLHAPAPYALHVAAKQGNVARILGLEAAGASIHDLDQRGCSVLELAAKHGHITVVHELLQVIQPSASWVLDCTTWLFVIDSLVLGVERGHTKVLPKSTSCLAPAAGSAGAR